MEKSSEKLLKIGNIEGISGQLGGWAFWLLKQCAGEDWYPWQKKFRVFLPK